MASQLLEDWCKGMNVNPKSCILVQGVPEGFDEGTIESTLEEHIAKCVVRGRMFQRGEGTYVVLCEFDKVMEPLSVPKELEVVCNKWKIVTVGSQSLKAPASDIGFLKKMTAFLKREGKTMADIPDLLGLSPSAPDQETPSPAGVWEKVLEKVLDKAVQPRPDSYAYHKLRLFSGSSTPLPGEEEFEPWLEHATEMLLQWAAPDCEKRRCLIEGLKGPALDVIRTLKLIDPDVSVKDCLEALTHAFGETESSEDAYCKFLSVKQERGEKVSHYVQRLEKLLQRAVMRGAVAVEKMDQTRLAQVLRGVQYQDFIPLHLRLRERQKSPPGYSQLIKEIREEEERQGTHENGSQPCEATSAAFTGLPGALMVNGAEELAQQVQILTDEVAELLNTHWTAGACGHTEAMTAMVQKTKYGIRDTTGRQPLFCYRCGQEGHIAARCQNDGNPTLVYQKRQATRGKPGNRRRYADATPLVLPAKAE
uniref:CCHC-type domain-containing protein n=1 Tax=Pelusios castaneus TaxID=367368 RepID=A0A8C8SRU8_9SAUR